MGAGGYGGDGHDGGDGAGGGGGTNCHDGNDGGFGGKGGNGGDNLWTKYRQCHGTGGGGGGGVVISSGVETNVNKIITKGFAGKLGYTQNSMPPECGSLDFGAKAGEDGLVKRNFQLVYSDIISNLPIDTLKINSFVCDNKSYTLPDGNIVNKSYKI